MRATYALLPVASLVCGIFCTPALAAGFQLNESSASGLGTAFAGGAASGDDASTLWSNPAGMMRVQTRQAVGVLHLVRPTIRFRDEASVAAAQQPLGGDGGDAGGLNVVPNLYFVQPMGNAWRVGLGVTAPWGLVTEYDDQFIGRFQATKSSIRTLNLNPSVAWRAADGISVGAGLNIQRMQAEFNNLVNYSAALLSAAAGAGIAPGSETYAAVAQATPGLASKASVKGADNAFGWNIGVLWDLDSQSRVGLHYRSPVSYRIAGDVRFTNPALPVIPSAPLAGTVAQLSAGVNAGALFDSAVNAKVKLPPIVNLSAFRAVDPRWDVMADLQWTGWSTIRELRFVRGDGTVLQSTPEHFKDSWKLAVGASYRPGGMWRLRGGLAWDQSPVRDEFRTPRLPDANRLWVSAGAQYLFSDSMRLDFGAAYLSSRQAGIDKRGDPPSTPAYGLLNGHYDSHTVIVSAQMAYAF
jgi:long-chain fatty acid transport protein